MTELLSIFGCIIIMAIAAYAMLNDEDDLP
jgi:hypothetical protein